MNADLSAVWKGPINLAELHWNEPGEEITQMTDRYLHNYLVVFYWGAVSALLAVSTSDKSPAEPQISKCQFQTDTFKIMH